MTPKNATPARLAVRIARGIVRHSGPRFGNPERLRRNCARRGIVIDEDRARRLIRDIDGYRWNSRFPRLADPLHMARQGRLFDANLLRHVRGKPAPRHMDIYVTAGWQGRYPRVARLAECAS